MDGRLQCVGRELHAHLIIATPCRAVEQHANVLCLHLRQDRSHRYRASYSGCIPVSALIPCLRLDNLQPGFRKRLLPWDDMRALRTTPKHSVLYGVQILLVRLSQVHREAMNRETFALQPVRNRTGVQATGDRSSYLSNVVVFKFAPVH